MEFFLAKARICCLQHSLNVFFLQSSQGFKNYFLGETVVVLLPVLARP